MSIYSNLDEILDAIEYENARVQMAFGNLGESALGDLMEEVGDVAAALNEMRITQINHSEWIRDELIQVASVAIRWISELEGIDISSGRKQLRG